MSNIAPIFIIGSERSGSNLLRTLVANHSMIDGPVAPHFFDAFWNIIPAYGDLRKKNRVERLFKDMLHYANHEYNNWGLEADFNSVYNEFRPKSFLDVFHTLYTLRARGENAITYFCKGNHIINYALQIKGAWPNAKFIYLHRDPRDHAASWKKNPLFIKTAFDANRKWNRDQDQCHRMIHGFGIEAYYVKYEELIVDPARVMTGLQEYVGVPVEEACFQTDTEKQKEVNWNKYWKNLSKPIMSDNKKNYLKAFEPGTINMIETFSKKNMERLGYGFETEANWESPFAYRYKLKLERRMVGRKFKDHIEKDMVKLKEKLDLLGRIKKEIRKEALI